MFFWFIRITFKLLEEEMNADSLLGDRSLFLFVSSTVSKISATFGYVLLN